MKEKEIIKLVNKSPNNIKKIIKILCIALFIVLVVISMSQAISNKSFHYDVCKTEHTTRSCVISNTPIVLHWLTYSWGPLSIFICLLAYIFSVLFIKYFWEVMELTVTNKRVYGKTFFGRRVDLPLDSISSIGKIKLFRGVSIATPSGKISFYFIANDEDVYNAISKLLVERQDKKDEKKDSNNSDYIEELKKLKELMDEGIITQEEFETKKKELLK